MERKQRYIVAALWSLFILLACLINSDNFKKIDAPKIENLDKLVHFGFYTLLTMLWIWCLRIYKRKKTFFKNLFLILLLSVLFGILIEFLQEYTTNNRAFEWLDVLANTTGALFGAGFVLLLLAIKNKTQR